jgi:hypothetical protein
MDAVAACRYEPLRLLGRPVEQAHDGARDAEQRPQRLNHGPRNRLRRFLGEQRPVDLVQDPQALRLPRERRLRLRGGRLSHGQGGGHGVEGPGEVAEFAASVGHTGAGTKVAACQALGRVGQGLDRAE